MHVLIVDDHRLIHDVLAAVARKAIHARCVHSVENLEDALDYGRKSQPLDLALLDLGLPGCSSVDALIRFRNAFPSVPVLVVSGNEDEGVLDAVMQAGAKGFVPKTSPPSVLEAAVRSVAHGGTFVPTKQH